MNNEIKDEGLQSTPAFAKLPVVSSAYVPEVRICTTSGQEMYKCKDCHQFEYDVTTEGECYVCFMMRQDAEAE